MEDIGFLQMSGGDWVLYKYVGGEDQVLYQCVEDTKLCTSVRRRISFSPVCGGDWVLYKCVEEIGFCTSLRGRLSSVKVFGGD